MAFWGIEVKPKKPFKLPFSDFLAPRFHLSQATLGRTISNGRTIVKCTVGDKPPIYVCSFLPGTVETCSLDLYFDEDVTFSVKGPASVHLAGYFDGVFDGNESGEDVESDGYSEEEEDEDSDSMNDFIVDDDGDYMSEDDSDEDWSSEDNDIRPRKSGVTIKELSDDSEPDEKSIVPVKAVSKDLKLPEKNGVAGTETEKVVKDAQKQVNGNGNLDHSNVVSSSEDEDGFRTKRKRKHKDMSNAQSVENDNESVPHVKPADRGSIDSNEGAVPVEEPVTDTDAKLSSKKKKKKKKKRSKESLEDGTGPLSKADADGSVSTSLKPIHREGDMKVVDDFRDASDGKKSGNKKGSVRKYPNGLQIENVKMGVPDGKQATPGKKVGMVYTGRLQSNNKIFDSNVGKKPFFFRLGVGEVIKGWDIGVNGMRVGDKRRLIIPPEMGYGSKGVPGIPPNSWLNFDVELVEVK